MDLSAQRGWEVVAYRVCRDDRECLAGALIRMADIEHADVVFTCGGTGFGPRDVTPEATLDVADREAPGIAEYIRAESLKVTGRAMLSRGVSALRGTTLVINLPGSEKAARESFSFVADQLEHAVEMMAGGGHN
jgi:molybdenum cofactor synthesis domain-containing protein